jgi:pyrimidine-nucleoside phosphorylase
MLALRLIERKRNGGRLEPGEWRALALAYAAGHVPDYQMAALLMACYLKGLDRGETVALTEAMLRSGETLDTSGLHRPAIDKHSIGGVGDKVSIVLAPLVAAAGLAVPMMSGRGLGHTGGTLDKLESIAGFRTDLSLADARKQLQSIHCVLIGQTSEIAPVDKKIYALRNATATVDSIPLIAASIMSKKLAEGLDGLVLDVKLGSGAFVQRLDDALALGKLMIELGHDHQCPTVALITAMDRPLGRACGNALEIEEAIQALTGEGPSDLMEVTFALGVEMLMLGGFSGGRGEARATLEKLIRTGAAAEQFRKIIAAQGGDPRVVDDPGLLPQAQAVEIYSAPRRGFIAAVEPRAIGKAIIEMGGGRSKMDDTVDPSVGLVITAKPGDWVEAGEPLGTIFARDRAGVEIARQALGTALRIGDEAEPPLALISHRISQDGVEQIAVDH